MFGRAAVMAAAVGCLAGALAAPAASADRAREQLPNLTPLSPTNIAISRSDDSSMNAVRFDATIWNSGDYAFELLGRPTDTTMDELEAEQCVAWAAPYACSERRNVGKLIHHEVHGHWHFDDFALYELRRFRRDGSVDMTRRGLVAASGKVSFCLQDVERAEDGAGAPAPWPLYYGCSGGRGVMGISPGWLDIYGPSLPGQQIPLNGVDDGIYALVIRTDPGGRVYETNDSDNVAVTGIKLHSKGRLVRLLCTGDAGTLTCDRPPPSGTG